MGWKESLAHHLVDHEQVIGHQWELARLWNWGLLQSLQIHGNFRQLDPRFSIDCEDLSYLLDSGQWKFGHGIGHLPWQEPRWRGFVIDGYLFQGCYGTLPWLTRYGHVLGQHDTIYAGVSPIPRSGFRG